MPAYNFKKQFVPMIIDGQKPHTIRKRRKRPTKVGDVLKMFTGMRTKNCFQFAQAVCTHVEPVIIYPSVGKIMVDGAFMTDAEVNRLARRDGFESTKDFFMFFETTYGDYELDDFEIIWWKPGALEVQGG